MRPANAVVANTVQHGPPVARGEAISPAPPRGPGILGYGSESRRGPQGKPAERAVARSSDALCLTPRSLARRVPERRRTRVQAACRQPLLPLPVVLGILGQCELPLGMFGSLATGWVWGDGPAGSPTPIGSSVRPPGGRCRSMTSQPFAGEPISNR